MTTVPMVSDVGGDDSTRMTRTISNMAPEIFRSTLGWSVSAGVGRAQRRAGFAMSFDDARSVSMSGDDDCNGGGGNADDGHGDINDGHAGDDRHRVGVNGDDRDVVGDRDGDDGDNAANDHHHHRHHHLDNTST